MSQSRYRLPVSPALSMLMRYLKKMEEIRRDPLFNVPDEKENRTRRYSSFNS